MPVSVLGLAGTTVLAWALGPWHAQGAEPTGRPSPVSSPPASLGLDPFYAKYVDAEGIRVVGSRRVSDYALLEAAYLANQMLAGRPDVRAALVRARLRVIVMACDEFTTDVPEHRQLEPKTFWDKRARGLGATRRLPAVSCAEENLLGYRGDPYATESIFVHEFAHTLDALALRAVEPDFRRRLDECFAKAKQRGLWQGTYAAVSASEYWAEGVQSWFDTNRPPDHCHNHVNTREELTAYDPDLARLIAKTLGDPAWRYERPERRREPGHLEGFDRSKAPTFSWPPHLAEQGRRRQPEASPQPAAKKAETK